MGYCCDTLTKHQDKKTFGYGGLGYGRKASYVPSAARKKGF